MITYIPTIWNLLWTNFFCTICQVTIHMDDDYLMNYNQTIIPYHMYLENYRSWRVKMEQWYFLVKQICRRMIFTFNKPGHSFWTISFLMVCTSIFWSCLWRQSLYKSIYIILTNLMMHLRYIYFLFILFSRKCIRYPIQLIIMIYKYCFCLRVTLRTLHGNSMMLIVLPKNTGKPFKNGYI